MRKGDETRAAILEDALALASVLGLEGLTIGSLAKRNGMSKSGLFAHFESKEGLQIQVLEEARDRFVRAVVSPALREPRGAPRVRALFRRWLAWSDEHPGGCPLVAASTELDDREGPVRDVLVAIQRDWVETLQQAARSAVDEGHLDRSTEPADLAFRIWGLLLAHHAQTRLLEDPEATPRAERSLEALLAHE